VWPIATGRLRKYTDNSVDELVCDVGYDVHIIRAYSKVNEEQPATCEEHR